MLLFFKKEVFPPLPEALEILHRVFGFPAFRGLQERAVRAIVAGEDALVLMPTGGGKSVCYQVPALVRDSTALVISPLIALMDDQIAALRQLGVSAGALHSELEPIEASRVSNLLDSGKLDLLYVSPERLLSPGTLERLGRRTLALIAIDEAHCVSAWGHEFRPEYRELRRVKQIFPGIPRVALTATADPRTREDILAALDMRGAHVFAASFHRPNLHITAQPKTSETTQLLDFLKRHTGQAGIVYCGSRAKTERTTLKLREKKLPAVAFHAGLGAIEKRAALARFRSGEPIIMIATIAFGMGIDKPDVRFVAHLDLPKSVEGYYQETGRAGRDGLPSTAWLAYGLQDVMQQRRMIDGSEGDAEHRRRLGLHLDAMLALCETVECRRVQLLGYFGEESTPCGNCDTCLAPPESWDGTVPAQKLLSTIVRLQRERNQKFGAGQIVDILLGRSTARITQNDHASLSTFGIGTELTDQEWRGVVRQLLAQGLLAVQGEYGTLVVTEASTTVLAGQRPVMLRREPERAVRPAKSRRGFAVELPAGAAPVFERLRMWRAAESKEQGVPAYVIFHDATLREIATGTPTTLAELGTMSGVGENKLAKYGEAILEVLRS